MICPHCNCDTEKPKIEDAVFSQWFEECWNIFWRKCPKKTARESYKRKVHSEEQHQAILLGLKADMPEMMKREECHRPHFSTWLNQERYKDTEQVSKVQPRVIACELCGDTGIMAMCEGTTVYDGLWKPSRSWFERCSCARGSAPGLVIPQPDANDPPPF